ncbi:MAG TPA: AAA family ATPase [Eubacteriales bacterium]|nr:AAA family ATPase [Clostridia bacterium]HRV72834.1 AAA family ATPase [Eubacteriales bacterium]
MTKIIAIANQKGGVGKTTTAVNLSSAVAQNGKRTLLIDLDPQGNSSSGLGVLDTENILTSYDVLINGVNPMETIIKTDFYGLSLIPANIALAGAEVELVDKERREFALKLAMERLGNEFDYIFIDCPPSLGLLTLNALTFAGYILIPIQCEYYALEGVAQLMNTVRLVRRGLNPALDIAGVVLTMYDSRTKLCAQVVEEVKRSFKNKVYNTIIPRSVRLGEAPSYGQPINVYAPKCASARAYDALAMEVIKREGR